MRRAHFEPGQRIASWVLQQERIGAPQVIVMGGTGTAAWFLDKPPMPGTGTTRHEKGGWVANTGSADGG